MEMEIFPPLELYEAAMFTRLVELGEINPSGECEYDGYTRIRFLSDYASLMSLTALSLAELGVDGRDTPSVACVVALDMSGKVAGVLDIMRIH